VIKILVVAVSLGVLYFLMKSKLKSLFGGNEPKVIATDMEKDPICDTYVQRETPYRLKYQGKVYYFCSQECADKFKVDKG
jgi:YHS domain-containing protein